MYEQTSLERFRGAESLRLARRLAAREQQQRVEACLAAWDARTAALDAAAARTLRTQPASGYALARRIGTLPASERRP